MMLLNSLGKGGSSTLALCDLDTIIDMFCTQKSYSNESIISIISGNTEFLLKAPKCFLYGQVLI